jgi:hypothetical protein
MGVGVVRETGALVREGEKRIAFRAAEYAARVFAQKEDDEGEHEAEADRERERNDVHGGSFQVPVATSAFFTRGGLTPFGAAFRFEWLDFSRARPW